MWPNRLDFLLCVVWMILVLSSMQFFISRGSVIFSLWNILLAFCTLLFTSSWHSLNRSWEQILLFTTKEVSPAWVLVIPIERGPSPSQFRIQSHWNLAENLITSRWKEVKLEKKKILTGTRGGLVQNLALSSRCAVSNLLWRKTPRTAIKWNSAVVCDSFLLYPNS